MPSSPAELLSAAHFVVEAGQLPLGEGQASGPIEGNSKNWIMSG